MRNSIHVNELNEVMNCDKSEKKNLYVGLCGTMYVGSDRYAVVITEVISPKCVRVSHMIDIDYEGNRIIDENGNEYLPRIPMGKYCKLNEKRTKFVSMGDVFKLRKNGRWIREGQSLWSTGAVHFGRADEYRDPSF